MLIALSNKRKWRAAWLPAEAKIGNVACIVVQFLIALFAQRGTVGTRTLAQPHLSDIVHAPPFVYLSGQLALSGGKIVPGEIAVQTRQCLQNIAGVLDTVGLGLSDIVKTTVWLRRAGDFADFNAAYAEVFGNHRPARSTIVSDFVVDGALVEIEVVARSSEVAQ